MRKCSYIIDRDTTCGARPKVTVEVPNGIEKVSLCREHDELRGRYGVMVRLVNSFFYLPRRLS